jgi:hypothetical protein
MAEVTDILDAQTQLARESAGPLGLNTSPQFMGCW